MPRGRLLVYRSKFFGDAGVFLKTVETHMVSYAHIVRGTRMQVDVKVFLPRLRSHQASIAVLHLMRTFW